MELARDTESKGFLLFVENSWYRGNRQVFVAYINKWNAYVTNDETNQAYRLPLSTTYISKTQLLAASLITTTGATAKTVISPTQCRNIVQSFNPHRNASSSTTPLQVGNGNFAFGADVTGSQPFSHFAIQSTTAWHNSSLPSTPGQTAPDGTIHHTFWEGWFD